MKFTLYDNIISALRDLGNNIFKGRNTSKGKVEYPQIVELLHSINPGYLINGLNIKYEDSSISENYKCVKTPDEALNFFREHFGSNSSFRAGYCEGEHFCSTEDKIENHKVHMHYGLLRKIDGQIEKEKPVRQITLDYVLSRYRIKNLK